ncbi:MAG TPA: redoxin domain-containing protein [Tepidisphaeraceae bacterium]|nr:redoxin domain-containing protein [Tepidisphaeraceae bacterium]
MISSRRCAHLGIVAAGVVLASSLGILYAFNPRHAQMTVAATPAGELAPAFRLQDLEGRVYDSQTLRGEAVVVFFSSVHCGTCGEYDARLRDLAHRYERDPRVQFLALNQDITNGDQQRLLEVRVTAKVTEVPFPTLLDVDARTAKEFGARPADFAVIDPEGVVRYVGRFDDSVDPSNVTRDYVADELRRVLNDMPTAIAAR